MKNALLFLLCLFPLFAQAQRAGRLYAMLVGVSEYRRPGNNLMFPQKDAMEMYGVLKQHTDFSRMRLLTNSQARKADIVKSMSLLFAQAGPNDIVIFFFSGHGNNTMLFSYDEPLTFRDVSAIFKKCRAKRKIIFADACFSGTFRQSPASHGHGMSAERVLLFLSSRSNQTSVESPALKNGAFTYFLLEGLRGSADANHDRKITARELFDFVSPNVKQYMGGRQTPVMWGKFENNMIILNL